MKLRLRKYLNAGFKKNLDDNEMAFDRTISNEILKIIDVVRGKYQVIFISTL